jgi:acetyl-CoA C-acetyltransferase
MCSYWPEEGGKGMTFPGLFAELAKAYIEHYKLSENEWRCMLAHVAAS